MTSATPRLFRLNVEVGDLVTDLDALHARAASLGCLSPDSVHGTPAGAPVVRPWSERSFYADDPWGNPLCFVEEGTLYEG